MALSRLHNVLDLDLSVIKDEKMMARVAAEQRQAASAILSAQVRVDEARFRADSIDRVGQILEEVKKERFELYPELRPPKPALSYEDVI